MQPADLSVESLEGGVPTDSAADGGPADSGDEGPALAAGTLQLVSIPRAVAYVNGKRIGLTPLSTQVRPGRSARVVMVASGRAIHRETVEMDRTRGVVVNATLKPARYPRFTGRRRGVLRIKCHPSDRRRVLISGQDTGFSCPKVGYYLRPGRYRVGFMDPVSGKTRTVKAYVRRRRITLLRVRAPSRSTRRATRHR